MKCTIETGILYRHIEALFRAELARQHPRSTISLADTAGNATFTITAEDATSFRAAVNSITSILAIDHHGHARTA